jgi:hypothetical protein
MQTISAGGINWSYMKDAAAHIQHPRLDIDAHRLRDLLDVVLVELPPSIVGSGGASNQSYLCGNVRRPSRGCKRRAPLECSGDIFDSVLEKQCAGRRKARSSCRCLLSLLWAYLMQQWAHSARLFLLGRALSDGPLMCALYYPCRCAVSASRARALGSARERAQRDVRGTLPGILPSPDVTMVRAGEGGWDANV